MSSLSIKEVIKKSDPSTRANKLGHHWELSYDIFDRIDVTVAHRRNYVNYMKDSPIIAKRKKVNLKGLI